MDPDPIGTEVFRHLFVSMAEEMGSTLERTAYSPNIKERRDHSCAVFDASGRLIAQAAHIPVHLGAFPILMRRVVPAFRWKRGDVLICNDPYLGGTHLPDVSVISPVFNAEGRRAGFVANRAHHADIGGAFAGSMGATTEVYQEGVIIPPVKLFDRGRRNEPLLELICCNVRTPQERLGDLDAQLAANGTGVRRFEELLARYGPEEVRVRARSARARSRAAVRAAVRSFPLGTFRFTDHLDDDGHGSGPIPICLALYREGDTLRFDFSGSAPQQKGSVNAPLAVTHSAVYYAVVCLLDESVELNEGVFEPLRVEAEPGTIVNPLPPAAVAAGNVETSQRIVDVLFGALAEALPERMPAASQGTMNNLSLGGIDADGAPWAYYETVGGGIGGSPVGAGISGVHCHMSNTRNTPAEALEYHYPLRVRRYALREGSGGEGRHAGGCGVVREIELLAPASASLLTDRRRSAPYGLAGGHPGQPGENHLENTDAAPPIKGSVELPAGAVIRIETPGGGAWGN
jgi:N-methylhydantoinase B/oxoprolinase/acetone carboxylase alpha subunit